MKIDEILNDVVLLVLDGHDPLKELGIEKNKIYVKSSVDFMRFIFENIF